ncbi:MAG: hypothetical protein M3R15_17445 [Acidobacteriota bacterium]|nr:hypothetical protein [Acidobacteriota bacterium]
MKNIKTALLSVATLYILIGFIGMAGQASPTYSLTGRIKINPSAQGESPRYTVRVYFPKEEKRPVLVSYVDGYGRFDFIDLPEGSVLLEVYANSEMVYQKSIRISSALKLDDRLVQIEARISTEAGVKVVDKTTIQQRDQTVLKGSEFQGLVMVYVDDIHDNRRKKPFSIKIFETGTNKVIKEGRVPAPNVKFDFTYNGRTYTLIGATKSGSTDYLDFAIYRKVSR